MPTLKANSKSQIITVPNAVTVLRLALFLLFFVKAASGYPGAAFGVFVVIWVLDWVDGFLARTLHQETQFGFYFDKIADRILMAAGIVTLLHFDILPPVTLLLLARDVGYIPALYPVRSLEANWQSAKILGKIVTFLQGAGVVWLYFELPYPAIIIGITAILGSYVAFRHLRAIFVLLLVGILVPYGVSAKVHISEVMWDGTEYVELFSDSDTSLAGWRLARQQLEKEEKTIIVFNEDQAVKSGQYFLIEKNESATDFLADVIASSLTLVNGGEILRLYDGDGEVVDVVGDGTSWPAGKNTETGISMEFNQGVWVTSNGNEGGRFGTPRRSNSSGEDDEIIPPDSQQTYENKVVINEFLPNPTGADTAGEFIELYNPEDSDIDLSGWKLDDADGGSSSYQLPSNTILSGKGFMVFWSKDTKIALNNTGDEVRLIDPSGAVRQSAFYANDVVEGASYNRNGSGFVISTTTTPNSVNVITKPTGKEDSAEVKGTSTKASPSPSKSTQTTANASQATLLAVRILRILPNPVGPDDSEYIELKNDGAVVADIAGYMLDDEDGGSKPYTIPNETMIPAGDTLTFSREDTGIALNNTGDEVRLLDPMGIIVDAQTYGKVSEGQVIEFSQNEVTTVEDELVEDEEDVDGIVAGITQSKKREDSAGSVAQAEEIVAADSSMPQVPVHLTGGVASSSGAEGDTKQTKKSGIMLGVVLLLGAGVATSMSLGDGNPIKAAHAKLQSAKTKKSS